MSHRPYPDRDRALHQLERHDDEHRPPTPTSPPLGLHATFAWLAAYAQRRASMRTLGGEAAELMERLGYPPLPWQRCVLDEALEIDPARASSPTATLSGAAE